MPERAGVGQRRGSLARRERFGDDPERLIRCARGADVDEAPCPAPMRMGVEPRRAQVESGQIPPAVEFEDATLTLKITSTQIGCPSVYLTSIAIVSGDPHRNPVAIETSIPPVEVDESHVVEHRDSLIAGGAPPNAVVGNGQRFIARVHDDIMAAATDISLGSEPVVALDFMSIRQKLLTFGTCPRGGSFVDVSRFSIR